MLENRPTAHVCPLSLFVSVFFFRRRFTLFQRVDSLDYLLPDASRCPPGPK